MSDEETWRNDDEEVQIEVDAEERNCVSPNEGDYGDDESRDEYEDMTGLKQRKSRRNVEVDDDVGEEDKENIPTRRTRSRRQVSTENEVDDSDKVKAKPNRRLERLLSGSSEDEQTLPRKRTIGRSSIKDRSMSFEHSSDDNHRRNKLNSMKRQSVTSDGDESANQQSATERRQKWEKQASRDILEGRRDSKVKAFGGSQGASALKSRFENKAMESRKVITSSDKLRTTSSSGDGTEDRQHSASSLKARFEAKIQDNAPVKRNFVINRSGAAKKFGGGGAPVSNKCFVCTKTVYPMEKLEADGNVYHKFCFKCKTCNRTVGLGNYAALQGDIYCKPHLKQLFKLKGNYDEGFGREQRKADWVKKEDKSTNEQPAQPVQVNGGRSDGEDN